MKKALTVLLVEDEPLILLNNADELRDVGFAVLQAADAEEALNILSQPGHQIDLVFTDIEMPGETDGIQLAHIVRIKWPNISVILTSGGRTPKNEDLPDQSLFIPKPYSITTLLALIDLTERGNQFLPSNLPA